MNGLETEIVDINDDALDTLFNETPASTVNANTLIGAKEPTTEQDVDDVELDDDEPKQTTKKTKTTATKNTVEKNVATDIIEDVDIDADEDEEEVDEDDDEKKVDKTKAAAKVETTDKGDSGEKVEVLKATVDYLIEQGLWQDFEGREDMEFTEETYAKLVAEQDKLRVHGMFEELVDSTGPFGKAIIEFTKNGGNPDEIIDLFKEQKTTEAISIDKPEGQKTIIKQYYTDVMGWKPEKAEKYITKLTLDGELESEAAEVKDLYGNFYKKEADRLNAQQEEFATKQREAEQAFESNIRSAVKERKDLTAGEKKMVEEYLLSYDQKLPNGNMVNKFYVNFAKMQSNPADYVDLVMFVMDKQKFVQKVQKQEESKATAKAFSFIKGNGAVSKNKGTTYDSMKRAEKVTDFNWGLPSKR